MQKYNEQIKKNQNLHYYFFKVFGFFTRTVVECREFHCKLSVSAALLYTKRILVCFNIKKKYCYVCLDGIDPAPKESDPFADFKTDDIATKGSDGFTVSVSFVCNLYSLVNQV